ncbi:hypothetical protein PVAP13_5NG151181 [Panicum virgatum]|uniref:Uncharacterized protein n=1 Tax=Panicum virgatum TaxID=38727 RepID=A0A8T0RN70_PANVG|nr:hypothetical protein PVAP13_5NG151181 [Panicum virgatum]
MSGGRTRTSSQVAGGRARTGASGGRRARTGASGGRRAGEDQRRAAGEQARANVGPPASRRGRAASGGQRAGEDERPGGDERQHTGGRGRAAGLIRGGSRRESGGAGFFRSPLHYAWL